MSNMMIAKLLKNVVVTWKPLSEVCGLITTGKLNANAMDENGIYPFFTCNENPYKINNYAFDMEAILISGNGSKVGHINYFKGKFNAYQRTYILSSFHEKIKVMFLFYYLNFSFRDFIVINSKKGSVPYITLPMLEKFEIPIPPLHIQTEIVRILDTFTALTAELTAELTARKKQYNYYRDKLLTFKDDEVEWKALGEVAHYSNTRISFDKLNEKNYVGVDNLLQNRAGKTDSNHVPKEGNFTEYLTNDILIGNIRPYLKKIWQAEYFGGTNGDVLVIRPKNDLLFHRYLYHVLANDNFFEYNMQHAKGAKMPRGNKEAILKYHLPIPPLKEQARIVEILDKFDTLTNSITEGLPREIALRQKQYEYYRNLLLDFPKAEQ
ncbi:hypothetical protein A9G43_09575 [Gilliamella sp. Occ3-1]|uniref:restriction endonuclease subunit S n=1 Tax=Gilliamella sp. Occ3-1 TaxID=3120253 RepID=UPI00080E5CA1|nr:restriction endonuclease subunit S [Gilliamella apicola]OCG69848.1 hypothetical protein A9G43_09575 [Gilliamella apicola]